MVPYLKNFLADSGPGILVEISGGFRLGKRDHILRFFNGASFGRQRYLIDLHLLQENIASSCPVVFRFIHY